MKVDRNESKRKKLPKASIEIKPAAVMHVMTHGGL